ncbi:hypothetical protein EDC01DRAFT_634579 [Geopyxis carbonaria]|nr:hypothetical protein EDC01DRAFT_634579 [Geopyxis carbonaria]
MPSNDYYATKAQIATSKLKHAAKKHTAIKQDQEERRKLIQDLGPRWVGRRFVEKVFDRCNSNHERVSEADVLDRYKPTAPTTQHRYRKQTNWYHNQIQKQQQRMSSGDNIAKDLEESNKDQNTLSEAEVLN